MPALKFAREQGLFITLHCGEVGLALQGSPLFFSSLVFVGFSCLFNLDVMSIISSIF